MNHTLKTHSKIVFTSGLSLLASGMISSSMAKTKQDSPLFQITHKPIPNDAPNLTLTRFAFGSCWRNNKKQNHWATIQQNKPQFWLWLGDNVYADTNKSKKSLSETIQTAYQKLAKQPGYQKLIKSTPVIATWDDHDFGKNDAGGDFSEKKISENIFLSFFNEPNDSPRRAHPGIYTSYYLGSKQKRVQVILLDTRYFRSPLKKSTTPPPYEKMGPWVPDASPDKTLLGEKQWKWLEKELLKPARVRFIASSIQFAAPTNGYETWANFPLEQKKMIEIIKKTHAEGVIFLSGDIHSSEFNIKESPGCYPLFDFTSSSLNSSHGVYNTRRRIGPGFGGDNFGVVTINWHPTDRPNDPSITVTTKDPKNQTRLMHVISLSELNFSKENLTPPFDENAFGGFWETREGAMVIYKHPQNRWTLSTPKRTAQLKLKNHKLVGTWKSSKKVHGKFLTGSCTMSLTRNGAFIKGQYSIGNLPEQLDWAAWKAPWAFRFNWK